MSMMWITDCASDFRFKKNAPPPAIRARLGMRLVRSIGIAHACSISQLQTDLHLARQIAVRRYDAEARGPKCRPGRAPVRVVGSVEHLGAQLQTLALGDRELLDERQVEVAGSRSY